MAYTLQWAAIERETLALITVIGAARAQGAEVDIPSLAEARAHFDEWLLGDEETASVDETIMLQALGLGGAKG